MEVIPQLAILFMEVQLRRSNVSAGIVETGVSEWESAVLAVLRFKSHLVDFHIFPLPKMGFHTLSAAFFSFKSRLCSFEFRL